MRTPSSLSSIPRRALHRAAHIAHHGPERALPLGDPHALDETYITAQNPPYEAAEELADALSVMHDQLADAESACSCDFLVCVCVLMTDS